MTVKIGINGFGRIGRLAFRRIHELGAKSNDIEVVAINDLTSPALLAHLLKYDSTHGTFPGEVSATDDAIVVDGKKYHVYAEPQAQNIPWVKEDGVDFVLECTGFYTSKEKSQAHLDAGAKRVLISAPAGSDLKTVVYNVNDDVLTADDRIVSAGSCTTNCLAPMADTLNKQFGIKVGTMTTVHGYTGDQMTLDGPHRGGDFRRARAAAENIVPNSTGAAKAIGLVLPELQGKLQGHAQRVPVPTGSLTELVTILNKEVTVDEINAAMKAASNESFGYNEDQIVSSDIVGISNSSLFDATQTEVTSADGAQLVKTVSWYDNEMSYTSNLVRTLAYFAKIAK